MKIIAIRPGFEFEHEGVNVKAVESDMRNACEGCVGLDDLIFCSIYPCFKGQQAFPKQKHSLIYTKTPKQNEDNN